MSRVFKYMKDFYDLLITAKAQGVDTLPLVQPSQIFAIVAVYLICICKLGIKFMKNRQPFKIYRIILVYNGLQGSYEFIHNYKLFCQAPERLYTLEGWGIVTINYIYYLLKVADLFDTVFFILRKKFGHVSFLHVYHHAGMVVLVGGGVNYVPGGHGSSMGIINCLVHCIMYSYYFLALYKPDYKNNIWWKKYITQLQIIQFFVNIVHTGSTLFISNCEYPKFVAIIVVPQNIFMLILFADFYHKEYVQKPKTSHKSQIKGKE